MDGSNDVNCTVTGTITSAGSDLNVGVDRLVEYFKAVFYAYSGALHLDCEKSGDVDANGGFAIHIHFVEAKIDVIRSVYDKIVTSIEEIATAAKAEAESTIMAVPTDPVVVQTQIDSYNGELTDLYNNVTEGAQRVKDDLDTRAQAEIDDSEAQQAAEASIASIEEIKALAALAFQRWNESTAKNVADLQATVVVFRNHLDQAECNYREKLIAYLSAYEVYLNNQADNAQVELWTRSQDALKYAFEAACIVRQRAQDVHDQAHEEATNFNSTTEETKTDLEVKLNNLNDGMDQVIAATQSDVQTNEANFANVVKAILRAVRATVQDVVVEWNNLNDQGITQLQATITVVEDPSVVIDDTTRHIHRLCIRGGLAVCTQNQMVVVSNVGVTAKRATGDQYTAAVGPDTTPVSTPVDSPANTPVDSNTPANTPVDTGSNTNSASSLVFSFAVLVASLLVLF